MVNLTVEKQLETIIWPTVSVLYLGLLVSFVVIVWKRSWCYGTEQQGSVQRHNPCPQRRLRAGGVGAPEAGVLRAALHRDLVLAAQQLHQYPSPPATAPSPRPFVEFMNSFLYSFVDDILLVLLFLLACGWQISHQLFTVVCVAPAERLEEGDPVRRVHLFGHVHSLHDLVLLRFADRRPVQRVHRG